MESRGGGELASLFDDDPGGVNDEPPPPDEDNPLADKFCGVSIRPLEGNEKDVFGGVWIPKRP